MIPYMIDLLDLLVQVTRGIQVSLVNFGVFICAVAFINTLAYLSVHNW
jgi:hypothetical protein